MGTISPTDVTVGSPSGQELGADAVTYLDDNSIYGPVSDWATDFDHADPEYNKNAHAIWDQLRGTCPVAHTQRYGGTWLPTTHDLVHEIAYDTDHFSSRGVVVATVKPSDNPDAPPAPIGGAPPIEHWKIE